MSLEKAIEHGKEKRKPFYRRSSRIDSSCRPHGSCPWCQSNRAHAAKVREQAAIAQEAEA